LEKVAVRLQSKPRREDGSGPPVKNNENKGNASDAGD
jgi:hypothetical protein